MYFFVLNVFVFKNFNLLKLVEIVLGPSHPKLLCKLIVDRIFDISWEGSHLLHNVFKSNVVFRKKKI